MRVPSAAVLTLGVSLLAAGCSPFHRSVPEGDLRRANKHLIIAGLDCPEVPGVQGCGAQALATIIGHVDHQQSTAAVAAELPWHDVGATPVDLLLEARRRGLAASVTRGSFDALGSSIHAGEPVMIMLDAGLEVRTLLTRYPTPKGMPWAVVSGIARDGSQIMLAATEHRHYLVSRKDLDRRWRASDYCLIAITRPSGSSATTSAANMLTAEPTAPASPPEHP
jgi:hypothetical protein